MNGKYVPDKKFKTCVREIEYFDRKLTISLPDTILFSSESPCPKNIEEVLNNIKSRYRVLKDEKESKRIVYDENLVKEQKKIVKSTKEINYLDFMAKKKKWLKDAVPKS